DFRFHRADNFDRFGHELFGHVALVREIDARLDQSQRLDQPLPPGLCPPAQEATKLAERLAPLSLGFGADQIGETFHGGEVEPPGLEGPTGELPRLSQTKARQLTECLEHRRNDRPAPVDVKLSQVLAGLALGPRKPKHQRLVEENPRRRIMDPGQYGSPWLGDSADESLKREPRRWARDPDHRYSGWRRP